MNIRSVSTLLMVAAGSVAAGFFLANSGSENATTDSPSDVLYWVAPMDPNYRRDKPGKSPMGMDLVPVYVEDEASRPGVVQISPAVANNLGVRTEVVKFSPLSRRIDTVGYVAYDEDTLQHVHTRVEGWIEKLVTKSTGDRVEKGQLLFELYSPALVSAQEEYLAALRSGSATLQSASRHRMTALGIADSEIARLAEQRQVQQRVKVLADRDGVIAHLGVREGIYVTPSTEVMSVAQLDSVWVIAEVLERQASWVEPGQSVTVQFEYLPDTRLNGTVDYIYPELDPVTRTLKARVRFDNPGEGLRPNMFARVLIDGRGTGDIVNVPKSAVIRSGDSNRVVIDLGDGRYQSKSVLLGIESGDRIAIRDGLVIGQRVVTSAQFLIDSESNVDSALGRYEPGPGAMTE
ncbi:MAG: efflux RND transporter periplasmic adaptor subunit [Gammaproteobacteria bacterium]|nr:efflux RND transporter periplasmic adaptor subunit [Gammaproteobacteria bacterium]